MRIKSTCWLIFTLGACIATGIAHQNGLTSIAIWTMLSMFGGAFATTFNILEGE
jgi:hypothetical protein